jgi:hypothetical protein
MVVIYQNASGNLSYRKYVLLEDSKVWFKIYSRSELSENFPLRQLENWLTNILGAICGLISGLLISILIWFKLN